MSLAPTRAAFITPALRLAESVVPEGLLDVLAQVPDPRDPRGVRYRLATLLAIGVCALTTAGRNSLVAIGEWLRCCDQRVLAALGCPFDPMTGRIRCPDEKTLRDAYGKVDPAALARAGYQRLAALAEQEATVTPLTPEGLAEREQRRAHRAALKARGRPARGDGPSQGTANACAGRSGPTAPGSTSSPRYATRTR